MGLHEEFNGGVFLGFAAKDLGDDALHLAAETIVDQPGAPSDECITRND